MSLLQDAAAWARARTNGGSPLGLSTKYDFYLERWRMGPPEIPVAYLRVLSKYESSQKPANREGGAWGLLEIVPVGLADFNKRHGTSYTMADVVGDWGFPVSLNVRIGCESLQRIASNYQKNHPRTLAINWDDANWVALLTQGWNSGWSQEGGLQRVASYCERNGITVTPDNVKKYAAAAGATHWLSERDTWWCKRVARDYFRERGAAGPPTPPATEVLVAGGVALAVGAMA